jgi:hypothetical protein
VQATERIGARRHSPAETGSILVIRVSLEVRNGDPLHGGGAGGDNIKQAVSLAITRPPAAKLGYSSP